MEQQTWINSGKALALRKWLKEDDKESPNEKKMKSTLYEAIFSRRDGAYVTQISEIKLNREDMVQLVPPKWLSGKIIDAYLSMVETEANKPTSKVIALRVYESDKIFNSKDPSTFTLPPWMARKKILDHELVLLPININGMHWCLLAAYPMTNTIKIFDQSLDGSELRSPKQMARHQTTDEEHCNPKIQLLRGKILHFEKFILKHLARPSEATVLEGREDEEWSHEIHKTKDAESDGYNCGPFICRLARYLAISRGEDDIDMQGFRGEDLDRFRLQMAFELLEGLIDF